MTELNKTCVRVLIASCGGRTCGTRANAFYLMKIHTHENTIVTRIFDNR